MKRALHNILIRLLLVFILALTVLAQARAQGDTVCAGETSTWVVVNEPGVTYTWELYNDVTGIDFATDPGNCPIAEAFFEGGINTGDSVIVNCVEPGTYFLKVTATDSCTNNIKVGKIVAEACQSYAQFQDPEPTCEGDTAYLTLDIWGGAGPWVVTYTDGTTVWTTDTIYEAPYTFPLIPTPATPGSYNYWVTSIVNGYGTVNNEPMEPVTLIIKPRPVTEGIYRYDPFTAK